MSFILKVLGLKWPQLSSGDERVWSSYAPVTKSGTRVSPENAMTIAAVWAAVRLVSESVGMLPLHMYRRGGDGVSKFIARDHPVEELLSRTPNRWQTAMEWREMMQAHVELRGNAYSEIIDNPDRLGFADELIPLHPDRVRVEATSDGEDIYYVYIEQDGRERAIDPARMFHLKGLSSNGFTGLSPIAHARESLGLAMATEEHGARLFGQGTLVRGFLKRPMDAPPLSENAAKRIVANFNSVANGLGNANETVLLEEGMDWVQVGLSSEDAQFLESRKFQISEIARWFHVPPHMIGDLERATFSNIEEQGLEFVQYSLMARLRRWEQAISRSLILRDDVYFAEFNVEGLLRGDIAARYQAYATGRQWGWLSVNEIRQKENLNPVEDGDVYLQPLNMVPAGTDPETGETAFQPTALKEIHSNGREKAPHG